MGVLAVFQGLISFLFCGLKPGAHELVTALGGNAALLMLASPIRWAYARLLTLHFTGKGSIYMLELTQYAFREHFDERGFKLDILQSGECPQTDAGVLSRWREKNSFLCHGGQLFLLG